MLQYIKKIEHNEPKCKPIMCFHTKKHLKNVIWIKIKVNNKARKVKLSNRKGYSKPCHTKTGH